MLDRLLVIVPTRTRPDSVARLVAAWDDTDGWTDGNLHLVVDADDPAVSGYLEAIQAHPREGLTFEVADRWRQLVPKLNLASQRPSREYFAVGFAGDDHLPRTQGWSGRYLEELHDIGSGIVFGDDLRQHDKIPTQWAMTSDIVRALGGRQVPAPVEHQYSDVSVRTLGEALGRIRYLPDVVIEHMHYCVGKAEKDAQYIRVNLRSQYDEDRAAYRNWRRKPRGMQADVAAIRAGW